MDKICGWWWRKWIESNIDKMGRFGRMYEKGFVDYDWRIIIFDNDWIEI